jgi:hypothetical protein
MATGMVNKGMDEGKAIRIASAAGDRLRHADGGAASHAMRIARQKYDGGGTVSGGDIPWFAKAEARGATSGFTAGFGAGRNDKNSMTLGSSSYVLPADVVAGLGDGNSLAGAHVWDSILHSMPYGIEAPQMRHGAGAPRSPSLSFATGAQGGVKEPPIIPGVKRGGSPKKADEPTAPGEEKPIDVITADGEIIVKPRDVARIGARYSPPEKHANYAAMLKRGSDILDSFVKETRGRVIAHLQSLRGPVGSKNPEKGHT